MLLNDHFLSFMIGFGIFWMVFAILFLVLLLAYGEDFPDVIREKIRYYKNMKKENKKERLRFDVFEDILKQVLIKGGIGLGLLLGISVLLTFLSVAVYAAEVQHAMSLTDYLYSSNHTLLKFILFLAAGGSVVLLLGMFLAALVLFIYRKAWRSLLMLCLSVGTLLFLFFVPVPQNKTFYAARVKLNLEYVKNEHVKKLGLLLNYKTEVTTDYYPTYQEAKEEVTQKFSRQEIESLEEVSKVQKVKQPLLHFRLPKNPNPRAMEQEEAFY